MCLHVYVIEGVTGSIDSQLCLIMQNNQPSRLTITLLASSYGGGKVNEVLLAKSIKLFLLSDKTDAITNGVIEELGTFKPIPLRTENRKHLSCECLLHLLLINFCMLVFTETNPKQ